MANPNSDPELLSQWTDMSVEDIAGFFVSHPTYCMGPKEASDWWYGVEVSIRGELNKYDNGGYSGIGHRYRKIFDAADPRYDQYEEY